MCNDRSGGIEIDFVRNLSYRARNECNEPLLNPKVSEMIKKMVIMVKLAAPGVAHDAPRKRRKSGMYFGMMGTPKIQDGRQRKRPQHYIRDVFGRGV